MVSCIAIVIEFGGVSFFENPCYNIISEEDINLNETYRYHCSS